MASKYIMSRSFYLNVSMIVCRMTSTNGTQRTKISQISIILTYAVFGKLFETLMKRVVKTRRLVRFTVTMASKKKALK